MYVPPLFRILAIASIFIVSALEAQIEIFYFEKQKVFRVDAVVADDILMEEVSGDEVSEYSGDRSGSWWVRGQLPLDAQYAASFGSYEITRLPKPFQRADKPTTYKVKLPLPRDIPNSVEGEGGWNAFVVVAWFCDDVLSHFEVVDSNDVGNKGGLLEFEIPSEKSTGLPLVWIVRNGEVLKKTDASVWDRAVFEPEFEVSGEVIEYEDGSEKTALHYAAINGLDRLTSRLIESSRKLVRKVDSTKFTPAWYAAQNGRSTTVSLLLEAGAPRKDGFHDEELLALAAKKGHMETVKVLAPNKPKGRDQRDAYSWALAQSVSQYFPDISFYLLDHGAKFQINDKYEGKWMLKLFAEGYPELGFRLMDEFEVEPEYEVDGYGLLHSVASYADVDLLNQIASRGPRYDQMTDKGLLPADYAIGLGNVDAICWFYDNARDSIRRKEGMNPLTYAIKEGQFDSVECLIGYGADVNELVGPDLSPVMFAAFSGKFDIAELLAENGAVWIIGSKYMNSIVAKLVAADRSALLASVIEQGWAKESLIYETFSFEEAARFFESEKVLSQLESLGWEMEGKQIPTLTEVTQKPVLVNGLNVHYPLELQDQFGERSIRTSIALTDSGQPVLVSAQLTPEEEPLRSVVEEAVYKLRFQPAELDGVPSSIGMAIKVPLFVEFDPESVFDLADVHEKPHAIRMVTPLYPYAMQALRRSGRVIIEFILLPDGSVRRLRVVESNYQAFEPPAIACVKETTWEPAKVNGQPVASKVRIPIDFAP